MFLIRGNVPFNRHTITGKAVTISVYNLAGRKIFSAQTNETTVNYQLSTINFNSGFYFIEVKSKNGIATKKFVKE